MIWPMMHFGKVADFQATSSEQKIQIERAVSKYKNAQNLLDIADSYVSLPNGDMQKVLEESLKKAGNGVSETFFNQSSANAIFGEHDYTSVRNELAVDLTSIDLTNVAKYNFNKVTNANLAKSKLGELSDSNKGRKMGSSLLLEVLKRKHGFQAYLDNKKSYVEKLENILEEEAYIRGTLTKQLTEEQDLCVKMKLYFLKLLGSQKLEEIFNKWVASSSAALMQPVKDFVEKDNMLLLVHGWLMSHPLSKFIQEACYKSHTKSWISTEPVYSPGAMPVTIDHTEVSYGDAVRSWLYSSQGPKQYGLLISGSKPDNIIKKTHVNNPFTCFIAGTAVFLSNFESAPIEDLRENSSIIGKNGEVGIVSSEKVVQEINENTAIFGINGSEPFFTSGHPFWTQDGWRAVNPHLAKKDNHWLDVGQLTEGDCVRKVKSIQAGQIDYEWVRIDSIHFKDYPAGTKVYGVHLREGPRSYHANGYLVCLNYPEITSQNIVDGMKNLSTAEKNKLQHHMNCLEPILEKVLGNGPAKAMKSISQKYLMNSFDKQKSGQVKKSLKDISLPHLNLNYEAGEKDLSSYSMPKKMSVVRGHLFLDDEHVPEAKISNDNNITWARDVVDGKWEHGSVKLHGNIQQGHGFIALTQSRNDTKSLLSANFKAAANFNKYKCYKSSEAISKAKSSKNSTVTKWVEFGELEMGVDCSSGSCETVGKICIPPMDSLDDLSHHVIFGIDSKQQLSVTVVVPNEYWSYLKYTRLSGVFSMDFASFTGTCVSYDATKSDLQGDEYAWKGILEKNLKTESLLKSARNVSLSSSIHKVQQPAVAMSVGQSQDTIDGEEQATDTLPTPMAVTMAAMTQSSLNVDELYMITPPDSQSVHELTFSLLQDGMKYEMDSSLREKIMGVNKPTLDGDMISVATTYKDFLGKKFANANLMYALSESTTYKDKITDEQRNKLLYFWSGNDTGCLAQDSDYNKANNAVSRIAYIKSCPDIAKYVQSSQGGNYWAKKLYDKLNEPSVLNGLALAAEVSNTMTVIQKQSMVLLCLAPNEKYGPDFYRKIMMSRLNEMSSYFNGSDGEQEQMKEIFTDSIHQLILKILSGGDKTTKEVTTNLGEQLKAAMDDLNIKSTETNEEIANEVSGHFANMISDVITLFVSKSGNAWDKLVESVAEWQQRNPIKAGIFKFFSVSICSALWMTGIYFTIKTFMDWKNLKPEQKVQLIADSVDIVVRSIAGVPDMIENFQTSCKNGKIGFNFIKNKIKARMQPSTVDDVEEATVRNVEIVEAVDEVGVDEAIAEATSAQLEDVSTMVSGWQKMFAVTESFAKVTGLIAGVAGCVVVGFQIYRDFSTDAPVAQKALDICQGVTMGVATIAAAVGIFAEEAFIPIIGIVCAIVGIALAIAALFVHRDPPKPKPTEVDLYVEGTGGTYVNALTAPSAKWVSDYKKKHPDT